MSSKKMGRPKSDNPKSKTIEIRVNEEILSKLDAAAEKLNTNRSAIVRKGIEKIYDELQNKKKQRSSHEEQRCFLSGNHLNERLHKYPTMCRTLIQVECE